MSIKKINEKGENYDVELGGLDLLLARLGTSTKVFHTIIPIVPKLIRRIEKEIGLEPGIIKNYQKTRLNVDNTLGLSSFDHEKAFNEHVKMAELSYS